jgi:hypothetical protein
MSLRIAATLAVVDQTAGVMTAEQEMHGVWYTTTGQW